MVSWGEGQEKKIPPKWWCSRWRWDDKDNLQNALAMVVIERYLRKLKRNAMNENPTKRPRGANGGGEEWLKEGEGWNGLSMTACSLAPSRSRPSSIISIFKFHSFKLCQPLEIPLKMRNHRSFPFLTTIDLWSIWTFCFLQDQFQWPPIHMSWQNSWLVCLMYGVTQTGNWSNVLLRQAVQICNCKL